MTLHLLRRRRTADDKPGHKAPTTEEKAGRLKEAGQIIAIFALMLVALIGLVGIAIDVTYAWREELRVQRAADAAALAGVVYLPGNVAGGVSAAQAEGGKNGFTSVSAQQAAGNPRQMDVTVSGQAPTFFLRALGWDHFDISRHAHAVFILPVPMGSPDAYYGMFGSYDMCKTGTGSSCTRETKTLTGPSGETVTTRGFWAAMLSNGAGTINGDAYLPSKSSSTSGTNPQQDTVNHYDYAVVMPPGSSSGSVSIFDAPFCDTYKDDTKAFGTGDNWFSGTDPISSYFTLYDTNNTPYNIADDTPVPGGSSGSMFASMKGYDPKAGAPSVSGGKDCSSAATTSNWWYYHNKWYTLGGTLEGGKTYRLRTTTSPGASPNGNGVNHFALFAQASGGSPQIYGIGAMQMYSPLKGGQTSIFYLAQIEAQAGAGKTVEIRLWDPGDTSQTARVKILMPTATGWSAVTTLTWTAQKVASGATNCVGGSGSYIETSTGTTSRFNGCWVTIRIVIPTTYTAPQDGWWKIQYDMLGTAISSDETTWEVNIRGNPVHLIP